MIMTNLQTALENAEAPGKKTVPKIKIILVHCKLGQCVMGGQGGIISST